MAARVSRARFVPAPPAAPPSTGLTLQPTQPFGIVYSDNSGSISSYYTPGALVLAGRTNYQEQRFIDMDAAGGTVLLYLDAVIDNTTGTYHDLLINSSIYGAAVPRWPGNPQANAFGYINDIRPGSILHTKLPLVLEKMVTDNPHIAGFFADDLGSRSYFPNFDWDTWSSTDKGNYRAGAILIAQAFRDVCDNHGLMWVANGTWQAGSVDSVGGGYPDINVHGCSLAEGATIEYHPEANEFWQNYAAGPQWGTESAITNGYGGVMLVIGDNDSQRAQWQALGTIAYYVTQTNSANAPTPWGSFHANGLPPAAGGGTPPPQSGNVTFDAVGPSSSGASAVDTNTVSSSHTCAGSNRLLLVGVAVGTDNSGINISSVTYGGVSMTSVAKVHSNNTPGAGYIELFRLIAPAAGTATVVVTLSGTVYSIATGSVSFNGVNQTTPLGTAVTATGTATPVSATVTGATSGNMVADAACAGNSFTADTQSMRWRRNVLTNTGAGNGTMSTAATTGGSVTMAHTIISDWWATVAVEVKA